jgi:hypothetical protein
MIPWRTEARFGWNRRNLKVAAIGVLALVAAVVSHYPAGHGYPLWISVLLGMLGVVIIGAVTAMSANRRVALLADKAGLTLVGSPLGSAAIATIQFPWPSIEAIVLWGKDLPGGKGNLSNIGVRLRPGAPPVRHNPKARTYWQVTRGLAPSATPPELVDASVMFGGWRWSPEQLARAVAHYAPGVAIERHLY